MPKYQLLTDKPTLLNNNLRLLVHPEPKRITCNLQKSQDNNLKITNKYQMINKKITLSNNLNTIYKKNPTDNKTNSPKKILLQIIIKQIIKKRKNQK